MVELICFFDTMTDAQCLSCMRQMLQQGINKDREDTGRRRSSLYYPCQECDDCTFGVLWIHARCCSAIDGFQQVNIRNIVRSHHLPERTLGHTIEGVFEVNIDSDYPLF